jgi:hypothetical protein
LRKLLLLIAFILSLSFSNAGVIGRFDEIYYGQYPTWTVISSIHLGNGMYPTSPFIDYGKDRPSTSCTGQLDTVRVAWTDDKNLVTWHSGLVHLRPQATHRGQSISTAINFISLLRLFQVVRLCHLRRDKHREL